MRIYALDDVKTNKMNNEFYYLLINPSLFPKTHVSPN